MKGATLVWLVGLAASIVNIDTPCRTDESRFRIILGLKTGYTSKSEVALRAAECVVIQNLPPNIGLCHFVANGFQILPLCVETNVDHVFLVITDYGQITCRSGNLRHIKRWPAGSLKDSSAPASHYAVSRSLPRVHEAKREEQNRISDGYCSAIVESYVSSELPFGSLPCHVHSFVGPLHAHKSYANRTSVLSKSKYDQSNAEGRDSSGKGRGVEHQHGPPSHVLLGFQIALSAAIFVGSFWLGLHSLNTFVNALQPLIERRKIKWRDWLRCLVGYVLTLGSAALCVAPIAYWLQR